MKKIILMTLLLASVFTAAAQSDAILQEIFDHVKTEGYVPKIDDEGDITFKVSGTGYWIKVYDSDSDGYYYIEMACQYRVKDTTLPEVQYAVNETNGGYKLAKVFYIQREGGEFSVRFEMSCFVTESAEFIKYFYRYLSCVASADSGFFETLREKDTETE